MIHSLEARQAIRQASFGNNKALGHKGAAPKRKVFQLLDNGEVLNEFPSIKEAAGHVGISPCYLGLILSGKKPQPRHMQGVWISALTGQIARGVVQLDEAGNEIARYPSLKEAGEAVGCGKANICLAIKRSGTAMGFRWKYADDGDFF